jgi:ribosome maturation factor RimP
MASQRAKKIGKGKETVNKKVEILYEKIKEAIVIVSF